MRNIWRRCEKACHEGNREGLRKCPEDDFPELVRRATALSPAYKYPDFLVMPVSDAIRESGAGITIDFEVTPGSKTLCVPGEYNEWRKRIEVKLTEKAQKGKANMQLIHQLSELFGLSKSSISITAGAKSSQKTVYVEGISRNRAEEFLLKK